jgi:hypothetical protein
VTGTLDDSWYPSCVVKLTIRFDESLQINKPRDETDVDALSAQTQEARITGENTRATAGGDRTTPTGKHRPRRSLDDAAAAANVALAASDQRLPTAALTPGAGGVTERGSGLPSQEIEPLTLGTDSFTVIANRVPKKANFTLPHPRSAPTFNLTFDYIEFPIDPSLIRAVGVEIHIGAVSSEDFARGMKGEVDEDGRPFSILKTTTDIVDPFTGRKMVNDATLLFYGTADTWEVEHGENGASVVIEGREIRAILIDTKVVPKDVQKVKLDNPITEVIGDLLQTVPFENSFRLVAATLENEWPNGIQPSPGDADGMTAVRLKAAARRGAKTKEKIAKGDSAGVQTGDKATQSSPDNGGQASYWDLITNYCELVGGMPHIIGSMLWIRPVHRVFDVVDPNSKVPTPFAGGIPRASGEETFRVRRMVLGRDIKRLKISRKFGGVAVVPTVQTISYDDKGVGKQRLIFGQWPPNGSESADAKADAELLRVPMWGITSKDRLTQIARGIYEEIGRGETGGQAESGRLASFAGDNTDPDLLRLRPLEPVEFVVEASALRGSMPIAADVNRLAGLSFSAEVDELHKILGDKALARAFVSLARGAVREVLRYYQVVGVSYDWDKGLKTSLSFQNYIVPRHKETAVSDLAKTTPNKVSTKSVKVAGAGRKAKIKKRSPVSDLPGLPSAIPVGSAAISAAKVGADSGGVIQRIRRLF